MDIETARHLCLSLPQVQEADHFGRPAYKVAKKIVATLWLDEKKLVVKLPAAYQAVLCDRHVRACTPVPGNWGKQGWTQVALKHISSKDLEALLQLAWCGVALKKLAKEAGCGGMDI